MRNLPRLLAICICLATSAGAITLDDADAELDAKEAAEAKANPKPEAVTLPASAEPEKEPEPEPVEVVAPPKDLTNVLPNAGEIRDALDQGVKYLSSIAEKDSDKWLLPPVRQRKVVDHIKTQVTYKYSMKTVEIPVWEYETVTRMVQRRKGQSVNAVKVLVEEKHRRAVKQIGTKKVERLARDPNGTIERTHTHSKPVYGAGGPDRWRLYQMGCNAMGAYAVLRATEDPYNDSARTVANNLLTIIEYFGLPDTTWDLVWIAALFSEMGERRFKEMATKAAGKILDGQMDNGTPTGMWGPVCLNPKVLAATMKIQTKLGTELGAAEAAMKLAEKASLKGGKKEERKAQEADAALIQAKDAMSEFLGELSLITMMGAESLRIDYRVILKNDMTAPLDLVGLPEYIYNQTSADTESTALAVFGLTIAAKNGCIPAMTEHPKNPDGKPIVPDVRASDVLKRTIAILGRAQHKTGAFAENNFILPVTDFNGSPLPGMPVKANTFKQLPMPVTLASCVYGMDSVMNMVRIFGPRTGAQLAPQFNAAYGYLSKNKDEAGQSKDDSGFLVPPYDYYFWFHDAVRGTEVPDLKAVTDDLLKKVVRTQAADGSWKSGTKKKFILPSSHRERMKTLPVRYAKGKRDFDIAQAYVPFADDTRARGANESRYGIDDAVMSTAYSMLMLVDHLEDEQKDESAPAKTQ